MRRFRMSMTVILTVLCMCMVAVPVFADSSDTLDYVFDTMSGGRLKIDTDLGSITVSTGRSNEVKVTITRLFQTSNPDEIEEILNGLDIDVETDDNGLTIDTRYRRRDRWDLFSFLNGNHRARLKLRYDIVVPERYNVELRTRDDDIRLTGLAGDVYCTTSDGDIAIREIEGPVTAKTSDGDIKVHTVSGSVDVQTSDGNIDTDFIDGELHGRTSDGDITVVDVGGPVWLKTSDGDIVAERVSGSAECTSSDGDIDAVLIGQPEDECQFKTSDGNISVTLDRNSSLSIDAHTSDGRIDFDEMTVRLERADRHNLIADLNDGGPKFSLRTSDGDIRLRVK